MLIKCPKCQAVYNLSDQKMTESGLRMRCASCRHIWTAYPSETFDAKPKTDKATDLDKMFAYLSDKTDNLFVEKEVRITKPVQAMRPKPVVRAKKQTASFIPMLVALAVILTALCFLTYLLRFDIVSAFPQTEEFYTRLGIRSVPYGRNLEIQSLKIREPVKDNLAYITIDGIVLNTGPYTVDLPPLLIEIYDRDDRLVTRHLHELPWKRLGVSNYTLFSVELPNPTPYDKSVYVKFADQTSDQTGE